MRHSSRIHYFATIHFEKKKYKMRRRRITIGRTGNVGNTDIEVGSFSVISRRHLELLYDEGKLYLKCMGKNGIFLNGDFKENESILYRLPKRSFLRFPSTSMELSIHVLPLTAFKSVGYIRKHPLCPIRRHCSLQSYPYGGQKITASCPSSGSQFSSQNSSIESRRISKRSLAGSDDISPKLFDMDCVLRPATTIYNGCSRRKQQLTPAPGSTSQGRGISSVNETSMMQLESSLKTPARNLVDFVNEDLELAKSMPDKCRNSELENSRSSFVWDMALPISESSLNVMAIDSGMRAAFRTSAKPAFSFAQLIAQALASQTHRRLTLSGIYLFISQNYPYYRLSDKGWQNSIRHNLSLSKYFFKAPRNLDEPGKGCFWRMDPQFEDRLIGQAYKLRRPRVNGETVPEFVTYISLPSAIPTGQLAFSFVQPTAVVQSWSSVRLRRSQLIQPAHQPVKAFLTPKSFPVNGAANLLPMARFSESIDCLIESKANADNLNGELVSTANNNSSRTILNAAKKIFLLDSRISLSTPRTFV